MDVSDLNSYVQLIQDLICGTMRRHTFTPVELDLLLDVQNLRLRKAAKNEILRRYLGRIQQEIAVDPLIPLRLADFREEEIQKDRLETAEAATALLCATTASTA